MKLVLLSVLMCGLAVAKKGGSKNTEVDPEIVNPEEGGGDDKYTAEFNEKMVEGDIMPKGNGEDRNAVSNRNKLWPGGKVPYTLDSSLSSVTRQSIKNSIADYDKYTCIRWVPRTNEQAYVDINARSSGCYAWLGMSGGKQPLNLEYPGCEHKGTVIHEMLHTIGFAHEQARNDRDQYVTINWNNINSNMHSQFQKMNGENNQGFGYDYHSVMHYPDWGFAIGGRKAITTKDPSMQKIIGQRKGFSKQDIKEVNALYCNGKGGSGSTSGGGHITTGGGSTGGWGGSCQNTFTDSKCRSYLRQFGQGACRSSSGNFGQVCAKTCGNC